MPLRKRKSSEIDPNVDRSWREEQRADAKKWHEEWERDRAGVVVIDRPTHEVADGALPDRPS